MSSTSPISRAGAARRDSLPIAAHRPSAAPLPRRIASSTYHAPPPRRRGTSITSMTANAPAAEAATRGRCINSRSTMNSTGTSFVQAAKQWRTPSQDIAARNKVSNNEHSQQQPVLFPIRACFAPARAAGPMSSRGQTRPSAASRRRVGSGAPHTDRRPSKKNDATERTDRRQDTNRRQARDRENSMKRPQTRTGGCMNTVPTWHPGLAVRIDCHAQQQCRRFDTRSSRRPGRSSRTAPASRRRRGEERQR